MTKTLVTINNHTISIDAIDMVSKIHKHYFYITLRSGECLTITSKYGNNNGSMEQIEKEIKEIRDKLIQAWSQSQDYVITIDTDNQE